MNPSSLVEQCYQSLPQHLKTKPWEVTNHGRKILQTTDELNAYIAAYGEMHISKCRAALQNFPFEELENHSFEIFDWGCGQGLASLVLLDMLYERNILSHLKKIYLIEPSSFALNRAKNWVQQNAGPGVIVVPINKSIPQDVNIHISEIKCDSHSSINLFSNILDIRTLSLEWLAKRTSSLANVNYMICVGPKFSENTNTRISDFCGYFNPPEYFSNINSYPFSYTTRTNHAYGCETKCFVHNKTTELIDNYQEIATDEYFIDPYDYTTEILDGVLDNKIIKFYNHLRNLKDSSYDVFLKPNINCDSVDFILSSKSKGIILINICEQIENIESEFNRLENIKNHIFSIHLKSIKIDSIFTPSVYNCIKIALYFPNNTIDEINDKITQLNSIKNNELKKHSNNNFKEKDFFKYYYKFTLETNIHDELEKSYARGFRYEYYEELINIISTKWHYYKDGDLNFRLSNKQKEIVRNNSNRIKVKGVAGCGKTQVVANRAVEQQLKTGERVLILTYNISLIQYIRMRINQVPADFSPNMFEIINYHQFFLSKANLYSNKKLELSDFDDAQFFKHCDKEIKKYRTIIIDEVQDFKVSWLQSITNHFLAKGGSISVFGDGEQNIYDRTLDAETQMPSLKGCNGFPGGVWPTMNDRISLRLLNPRIASLSSKFSNIFLSNNTQISTQHELFSNEFHIRYWNYSNVPTADQITQNIRWILSEFQLKTKDVVILGQTINLLRDIEHKYVLSTKEKTMINFETVQQYEQIRKSSSPNFIRKNLDEVRRAAKTHFTTNCDYIKMSTIHSFKGWESNTIILIIQPEMAVNDNYDDYKIQQRENTPALIYTALTRARCDLFILNLNNLQYHSFFKNNIH